MKGFHFIAFGLQASVAARAQLFVENLANLSEKMFLEFDELLTVDDVEKGMVPATKYPTNELMRRKKEGKPLVDEEVGETMSRKKTTWPGKSTSTELESQAILDVCGCYGQLGDTV